MINYFIGFQTDLFNKICNFLAYKQIHYLNFHSIYY